MAEQVSVIIDPETGLDTDVPAHVFLLDDILSFEEVREALVEHGRATPFGLKVARDLIEHARRRGQIGRFATCNTKRCGAHDEKWWANFVLTIRGNLHIAIAVRAANGARIPGNDIPLRNAAKFLAWGRADIWTSYLGTRAYLRQLAWALGQWLAERTPTKSGLLKIAES